MKTPRLFHTTSAIRLMLAAGTSLALGHGALAQTWNGLGADNNWANGANWVGGLPPVNNGTANLIFGGVTRLAPNVIPAYDINSITFNNTAGIFSIGGAVPLTIRAGGIVNNDTSNQTLNLQLVLTTQTWNAAFGPLTVIGPGASLSGVLTTLTSGQPIQIGSPISGTGSIVKNGSGPMMLLGANTYAGPTTINQGSVVVGFANSLSDASAMHIGAAGVLDINSLTDTIPSLTGDPGSVVTLGSGTLSIGGLPDVTAYTFSGIIDGAGNLSKIGLHTQVLAGANTYSGLTTVSNGTLRLAANERLNDTSDILISAGSLELQSFTETVDQVTMTGGTIDGGGNPGTGTIIANSINIQGGNLRARVGGAASITKSNTSTNSLFHGTGSSYTGATTITGGSLITNSFDVLPDTTVVTVTAPGQLQMINFADTIAGIAGNGTIQVLNTTLTIGAGNANSSFPGVITDTGTSGTVTKIGTGSLSLSGANSFANLRVNQGSILLVGPERLVDSCDVVINAGQFIVEDERIDLCTLNGGEIRPVIIGGGVLRATQFTLNSGFVDATLASGPIIKAGAGTVTLAAANDQPFTRIDAGILQASSDAAFGGSNANIALNGGTLQLTAPMYLSRPFYVFTPSTIDCLGDCIITNFSPGILPSTLTKTGPGILSLGGTVGAGSLNINGGTVYVGPLISLPMNTVTIAASGTLLNDSGLLRLTTSLLNSGRVEIQSGARITGGTFTNNGITSGSGTIASAFVNNSQGDVRIAEGGSVLFSSTTSTNNLGLIEVIGGSAEFSSSVTNFPSTGLFFVRDATLRFNAGITNFGGIASSFGISDIFGDIDNRAGGVITISGGSDATFVDDVINNGSLRTSSGGSTVFLGNVSGGGSFPGTGTVYLEGDLRPGNSPGLVAFGGDVVFGSFSTLKQEIAGDTPALFDRTTIAGTAYLDGSLDVALLDGFTPAGTQSFAILAADEVVGRFQSVHIPPTTPQLRVVYTPTSVLLTVCIADYNFDNVVDFFDYLDFVSDFAVSMPRADFNDDGVIDFFDYLDFVQEFSAGC